MAKKDALIDAAAALERLVEPFQHATEVLTEARNIEQMLPGLRAELEDLSTQVTNTRKNLKSVQADQKKAVEDAAAKVNAIEKESAERLAKVISEKSAEVADLDKQAKDLQKQIKALDTEYKEKRKAKQSEFDAFAAEIDAKRAEYDQLVVKMRKVVGDA